MKYFISIVMVLLMFNLFAIAQSSDVVDPNEGGAIIGKRPDVKDGVRVIDPGDNKNYAKTANAGGAAPNKTEGKTKPCPDRDGRCLPHTSGKLTDGGKKMKSKTGQGGTKAPKGNDANGGAIDGTTEKK